MTECPPEFYECLTEEEYDEILDLFVENDIAMPEAMGDVEAASNFAWEILCHHGNLHTSVYQCPYLHSTDYQYTQSLNIFKRNFRNVFLENCLSDHRSTIRT